MISTTPSAEGEVIVTIDEIVQSPEDIATNFLTKYLVLANSNPHDRASVYDYYNAALDIVKCFRGGETTLFRMKLKLIFFTISFGLQG